MRGGEGLARAAEYAWFIHENHIVIPFYRQSSLDLKDQKINIRQETQYPFGNYVILTMNKMPEQEITFELFVPRYMRVTKLTLNGQILLPEIVGSFLIVKSKFNSGDQIVMEYAFKSGWVTTQSKDIKDKNLRKAMNGPLVLGFKSDKPVQIRSGARFVPDGENAFTFEGTDFKITPLYHLLDPNISDQKKYQREVLIKIVE